MAHRKAVGASARWSKKHKRMVATGGAAHNTSDHDNDDDDGTDGEEEEEEEEDDEDDDDDGLAVNTDDEEDKRSRAEGAAPQRAAGTSSAPPHDPSDDSGEDDGTPHTAPDPAPSSHQTPSSTAAPPRDHPATAVGGAPSAPRAPVGAPRAGARGSAAGRVVAPWELARFDDSSSSSEDDGDGEEEGKGREAALPDRRATNDERAGAGRGPSVRPPVARRRPLGAAAQGARHGGVEWRCPACGARHTDNLAAPCASCGDTSSPVERAGGVGPSRPSVLQSRGAAGRQPKKGALPPLRGVGGMGAQTAAGKTQPGNKKKKKKKRGKTSRRGQGQLPVMRVGQLNLGGSTGKHHFFIG